MYLPFSREWKQSWLERSREN